MRRRTLVLPVALLGLLAGCGSSGGGGSSGSSSGASSGGGGGGGYGAKSTASAPAPTSAAPAGSASAATGGSSAAGTALTGEVGKADAFTISLKTSTGADVKTLKAGSYKITVRDLSKIHDFHLTGPGVDKTTSVPDITTVTWSVTLKAGSYTYQCDPHAKHMVGSFTVS